MPDRLLLGKNQVGDQGLWVSKPGANVLALVGNSYLESLGDWYAFQEEFTGNGSSGEYKLVAPSEFGIRIRTYDSSRIKPSSNGTIIFSPNDPDPGSYFGLVFGNDKFIGSEYPILEIKVRLVDPNNSANPTATDSASFPDVAMDFSNAPIGGGAGAINHFKSGTLSGNTVNSWENTPTGVYTGADYSRSISSAALDSTDYPDYQTDGKYTTIFSDSEYRILQWDMSSQDTWMDPYKYITTYDTGNNPHPYSGQYRIRELYFYLNRNASASGNHPIWEIDYVRVKKKGVPKDAGSYGSVQDALIFSTQWMHTGLVHQTGTVTIGTQKAKIDGTTSDKLFSDTTRTTSNGIVSFPELPYIPLVLFQRIDPTGNTAYPGGEKEFSIASTEWENHTYPNTNLSEKNTSQVGFDLKLVPDNSDYNTSGLGFYKTYLNDPNSNLGKWFTKSLYSSTSTPMPGFGEGGYRAYAIDFKPFEWGGSYESSYPGHRYSFNQTVLDASERENHKLFGTFLNPTTVDYTFHSVLDMWDMEQYPGIAASHYAPTFYRTAGGGRGPVWSDNLSSSQTTIPRTFHDEWYAGALGMDFVTPTHLNSSASLLNRAYSNEIMWNLEKFENYKERYYIAKSLEDSPKPPDTQIPWKTPIPAPSHRAGNSFSDQIFTFYEARTFAYARASQNNFSLTCRNAIGNEGMEPVLNLAPVLPEEGTANVGSRAYNSMKFMNDNGNWGMFHPVFLTVDVNNDGTYVPLINSVSSSTYRVNQIGKLTPAFGFGARPGNNAIKLNWNSTVAANSIFLDKVGRLPYWDFTNPYKAETYSYFYDNVDYSSWNTNNDGITYKETSGVPNIKAFYDSAGLDINKFPAGKQMSWNPVEKLAPREYPQFIWSPSYSCHPLIFDGSLAKPNDDLPANTAQYGGTSGDFFGGSGQSEATSVRIPITDPNINHRSTASPDRGRYSGNTGGFYPHKYHREMHFLDTNSTDPSSGNEDMYFWWQYEAKRLSSRGITHPFGVVPESNTAFTNMNGEPGVLGQIKNQTAYMGGARNKKTATNAVTFDETNSHPPTYRYWVLRIPMSISAYTPEGD